MKKIAVFIFVCIIFISLSETAFGDKLVRNVPLLGSSSGSGLLKNNGIKNLPTPLITGLRKQIKAGTENKTDNLRQKAMKEINRRVDSLERIFNRIKDIKKLNESQKLELSANIQEQIDSLNALNSKIQNGSDIQMLRDDVKSILNSYRTYLLFMPVTQIIITADGIINSADKLGELSDKLQTRIGEIDQNDRKNLETLLADMRARIDDAKIKAGNAISAVEPLKPTDYPGNKQNLQNAREMLKDALKNLISAKQDAQKITVELRKLNKKLSPTKSTVKSANMPTATPGVIPTDDLDL